MNRELLLQQLLKETEYELFHYPETTLKQDIKYVIKRLLKPAGTPKKDSFFWTHAMLATALESAGKVEVLKDYYDAWIGRGLPIYNLDNVMNGYSLLYVYEQTKEEKYKEAAHKLYDFVRGYKKETKDVMPYRRHHPTHIYADGMGMIVPFLCRYGFLYDDKEAIKIGMDYMQDFLKYSMDRETGLPYHGYDVETKIKCGIIGWGRAVGWVMLSLADSLEYLPEGEEKLELQKILDQLVNNCSKYLRGDGYFSWQLTAVEGPKDTSATAMIGYAMEKAMGSGSYTVINTENDNPIIDIEEYKTIVTKIKTAIISSCRQGKIHDCSGECDGFSQYPQVYGAYPWSLGPGVRLLLARDCNK